MEYPRIHALIPAAGISVRFGGTTVKQYAHLLGKPVIGHSIEAVSAHSAVKAVTSVLAQDDGIYEQLVRPQYPGVSTTIGGETRAQSVSNGLQYILKHDPEAQWVLVHDAARPCLTSKLLNQLVAAAVRSEHGAILAVPVSDTIKRADVGRRIENTVDRSNLWRAQTPQMFRARPLADALTNCLELGDAVTDESSAMERAGFRPLLVEGSQLNLKITRAQDLALAEIILRDLVDHRPEDAAGDYRIRP